MKKTLYTLIASIALLISAGTLQAQVHVTYQVDITNYLSGGATLDPTGMRIAGTFFDLGALRADNSDTVLNWAPTDPGSAMIDMGSNIWSLTVIYPASSVGMSQIFKFVNGNWGAGFDEGDSGIDTAFVTEGCGFNDNGNYNRSLLIPGSDLVIQYCWSHCFKCDGSSPVISGIYQIQQAEASFDISPNLISNYASINYMVLKNDNVNMVVRSYDGRIVSTLLNKVQSPGRYNLGLVTDGLSNGIYFIQITTGGVSFDKRFVVNR